MTRRASVLNDELDEHSPLLVTMKRYGIPLTRTDYVHLNYLGSVGPEDEIPEDVEETFPRRFRRKTLIETPPASDEVQ